MIMISNFTYMKKLIFILLVCISGFNAWAANPSLSLMQAFDGRYNHTEGVTITEITQPDNYYYSIKVKDNPEISKQLLELFKEAQNSAESVNKTIKNGNYNILLNFSESGVTVGAKYDDNMTFIDIFLQSNDYHP